MNAVILAAGLGTRLRPLTDDKPKAMVEIDGAPMLQHQILKMRNAGFKRIVVNVHYMGEQIIDFLKANNNFGIDIMVSDERNLLLNTGGGIARAAMMFGDDKPVLVHNVDIFSNVDVAHYYNECAGCDALLLLQERETSRRLCFTNGMRLAGWYNVNEGEVTASYTGYDIEDLKMYAFSGIHVLSAGFAKAMPQNEAFPLFSFYLSQKNDRFIKGVVLPDDTRWVDAGTPQSLVEAAEIVRIA